MSRPILTASASQQQLGIAILRTIVGIVFMVHGVQKLFTFGFAGVTGAFGSMGVPMPGLVGPMIALLEFFGGLALVVGILTRLVALGLAFEMLGALFLVHLGNGFFLPRGYEYDLTLFACALALALAGPGAMSMDRILARRGEASR